MRWFEQFTEAGGPVVVGSVECVVVVGAATVVAERVGEPHIPQCLGHSCCVVGFLQSVAVLNLSHWPSGRWSLQGSVAASSSAVDT